jgi:cobalamin biosynthesis protein CobD/CbiB
VPTIWASIAVIPFLLFFTGSFSLFSIPANILIAPLVPIVMIGWWIATLFEQRSLFHPLISLYEYIPRVINSISQRVVEHNIRLVNTNALFMAVVIAFYLAIFIKHRIDTIRR